MAYDWTELQTSKQPTAIAAAVWSTSSRGCSSKRQYLLQFSWLMLVSITMLLLLLQPATPQPAAADPQRQFVTCDLERWDNTQVLVVQFNHLVPPQAADGASIRQNDFYRIASLYHPQFFKAQASVSHMLVHKGFAGPAAVGFAPYFYKIAVLKYAMKTYPQYDYYVWVDQDVILTHERQQLVCLLEHWQAPPRGAVTNSTPVLWIANDPDAPHNYEADATGQRVLNYNTGFMVFRSGKQAQGIIDDWWDASLVHTEYHHKLFWDQSSFNVLVRPRLDASSVHVLSCDDANGFGWLPQQDGVKELLRQWSVRFLHRLQQKPSPQYQCRGRYLTHAWGNAKAIVVKVMWMRLMIALGQTGQTLPPQMLLQANLSVTAAVNSSGS